MEHKDLAKLNKAFATSQLTIDEAILLFKSSKHKLYKPRFLESKTNTFYYGYISDTHIGHQEFDEPLFIEAAKRFNSEKVDFVLHAGDPIEGMSGRPGHIYELTHVGWTEQTNYCAELFSYINAKIFGIGGNHSSTWATEKSSGLNIGDYLESKIKNYTHLGDNEGELKINNIRIKLFHPNDGSGTSISAKLEKLIDYLEPKELPNILHSGHYHKFLYLYKRGVHAFESGTLCASSWFMRGQKLKSHKGYGLVKVKYSGSNIIELTQTFIPKYE